ncbi:MAG: LysM peptidoglycan-binding domain-containing protein [Lachnospiraceae bacterium]|nr:LysM peptidoglycan-binding domain-containing protein [Lachnospiraceae bacterium]
MKYNNEEYIKRVAVREKQLRTYKNIFYLFLIALSLSLIVFIGMRFKDGGRRANASSDSSYIYTSVLVEKGDTLYTLADRYYKSYSGTKENFITSICNINHIDSDDITAGEYIIIPLSDLDR